MSGSNAAEMDGLPMTSKGLPDYEKAPEAPNNFFPLATGYVYQSLNKTPVQRVIMAGIFKHGFATVVNFGTIGMFRPLQR